MFKTPEVTFEKNSFELQKPKEISAYTNDPITYKRGMPLRQFNPEPNPEGGVKLY